MTKTIKSKKDLNKEFKVGFKDYTISRSDYEDMPCPMNTDSFDDEQMTELAKTIGVELQQYNFDEQSQYYKDEVDDAFWKEMEECAVKMGMTYYEDEEEDEALWDENVNKLSKCQVINQDNDLYDWLNNLDDDDIQTLVEILAKQNYTLKYNNLEDCFVVS